MHFLLESLLVNVAIFLDGETKIAFSVNFILYSPLRDDSEGLFMNDIILFRGYLDLLPAYNK